jgi:hypothetical protein
MEDKRKDAGAPKVPDHVERKIGNVIDVGLLELNTRLGKHSVKANEIALDEITEFSKIIVAEVARMVNAWKKEKNNFTTRQSAMDECDKRLGAEFDNLFECMAEPPVTVCGKTKWAVTHFEGKVRRDIMDMIRGWSYD